MMVVPVRVHRRSGGCRSASAGVHSHGIGAYRGRRAERATFKARPDRKLTMRAGQLPIDQQVAHFRAALRRHHTLAEVLARPATMNLPRWYLVAACLDQTAWDMVTSRPPKPRILYFDLAYLH